MGRPYSMDLRERAIGRIEAGESCRSVSRAFELGEATVIRWAKRKRETGTVKPGQMGGHRPYLIAGRHKDWLVERIKGGDFTLVALTAELAERGLKVHERTVWAVVHRAGFSFKKNRAGHRAKAHKGGAVPQALEKVSGWG